MKWKSYGDIMKSLTNRERNYSEDDIVVDSDLHIDEIVARLEPCEIPDGYGSKKYEEEARKQGLYKVYAGGLADHGIPNGFYMVPKLFAEKLLFKCQRKMDGFAFAAERQDVDEYYEKNPYIIIGDEPTEGS